MNKLNYIIFLKAFVCIRNHFRLMNKCIYSILKSKQNK